MCQNQHFYQLINNHDARGASWGSLTPSVTGSEIGTKEARCSSWGSLTPSVSGSKIGAKAENWIAQSNVANFV